MIDRLIAFLQALGLPGLLGLAFVDSAGLPTGGGPDWMLLALAAGQPMMADLLAFVPAAVSGSALGCLVPYYLGRKGGQPFLARFGERRHAEVRDKINRYGLWTIVFSVVAPPPYPMKLFMLSAGVFGMPLRKFIPAVLLGRTAAIWPWAIWPCATASRPLYCCASTIRWCWQCWYSFWRPV